MEDIELLNFDGNVKEFRRNQLEEAAIETRRLIVNKYSYICKDKKTLKDNCYFTSLKLAEKLQENGIDAKILELRLLEPDIPLHVVVGVPNGNGEHGFIIDPTITQYGIKGQCVFETNRYPFKFDFIDTIK